MESPDLLRAFLADRDAPCPSCKYNLRGLTGEACPECRQPLKLDVALQQPVTGAWLGTILPLWVVGGIAGLFAILVVGLSSRSVMRGVRRSLERGQLDEELGWVVLYPMLVAVLLLPAAIALSRPKGFRWFVTHPHRVPIAWALRVVAALAMGIWLVWAFKELN